MVEVVDWSMYDIQLCEDIVGYVLKRLPGEVLKTGDLIRVFRKVHAGLCADSVPNIYPYCV